MREALATGVVLGTGVGTATTWIESGIRYGFNGVYDKIKTQNIDIPPLFEQAHQWIPSYQRFMLDGAAVGAATFGATATGLYAYHAMAGNVRY